MSRLALFDLDKTLVDADTARLFIRYEYRRGEASLRRVAEVLAWGAVYTAGWIDADAVGRRALSWYRGRDAERLMAETAAWAEREVLPRISVAARRAVEQHQARGDSVVLVTAQSQIAAVPVQRALGIAHLVCTTVGVEGGRLTGQVEGPVCAAHGKLSKVRAFVQQQSAHFREVLPGEVLPGEVLPGEVRPGEARLREAVAYADSITDLPLLLAVGEPVVVNPDWRLRRLARARGWRIETWSDRRR